MINVMYIFIFVNWDTLVPWAYQLCCLPSINNTIQSFLWGGNGWIRCKLSFALVRSAIMCIRGARSRLHSPVFDAPLDVQIAETHL